MIIEDLTAQNSRMIVWNRPFLDKNVFPAYNVQDPNS